jgi:hypothetical protein
MSSPYGMLPVRSLVVMSCVLGADDGFVAVRGAGEGLPGLLAAVGAIRSGCSCLAGGPLPDREFCTHLIAAFLEFPVRLITEQDGCADELVRLAGRDSS